MRRTTILVVAYLGLSGCAILPSNPFAGAAPRADLPYRADLSVARRGQPEFAVVVAAPGAPLEAFRESARFPGTRYCLRYFGSSEIAWKRDPASRDWAVHYGTGGRPVVAGRCTSR